MGLTVAKTNRLVQADKKFLGMNSSMQPEDLGPGYVQYALNRTVGRGDGLSLRDGFSGIWSNGSILAGPLYTICTAQPANQSPSYIIVASAGKLYRTLETDTAPVEILDAGAVSFAGTNGGRDFRIVQFGGFLLGVDGGNTAPFRIDIATWTTTRLSGITAPSTAISPLSVYTRSVDLTSPGSTYFTNWTGRSTPIWSSGPFNQNYQFKNNTRAAVPADWVNSGGGWNSRVCDDWYVMGQTERWEPNGPTNADITPDTGADAVAFLFDQPDNGVSQIITGIPDWDTTDDQLAGNARIYVIDIYYNANVTTGGIGPFVVSLEVWDADDNVIQTYERTVIPLPDISSGSSAGEGTLWLVDRWVVSAQSLSADPAALRLIVTSTEKMRPISGSDPSVVFIESAGVTASALRLTAGQSADDTQIRVERVERGTLPLSLTGIYTGYLWIRRVFTTDQDYSGYDSLTFGINWNPEATTGSAPGYNPSMRLGFQAVGGDVTWTPPVAYAADGRSFTASLVGIGETLLSAFRYLYIQLLEDMPVESDGTAWLFDFGPITSPSLTPGLGVQYYYSYFDGTIPDLDDPLDRTGIESSRSPVSVQVEPTDTMRAVTGTIPAGAYPAGTDYLLLWRVGGSFDDGRGRLVAAFPVGSNDTGPTYSWNFTTRVFQDWTPDTALLEADRYEEGRNSPPIGATSILTQNGRLVLAKENQVFFSWVLSQDPADGVYFTDAADPTDPSFLTKGVTFTIDGVDGPPIVALSTRPAKTINEYGSLIIAWREREHIPISGSDPGDLRAWPAIAEGLFAPRGLCHDPYNRAYHIGDSGVYRVRGEAGGSELRSDPIENLFSSRSIGNAAGYKKSSLLWHDRRLYAFAPAIGGSDNTLIYVRDERIGDGAENGWSVLSSSIVTGFTGGITVGQSGDTNRAYFAGRDGQLYRLVAGQRDRLHPTATLTAISWLIRSRAFGQNTAEGTYLDQRKRPQDLYFGITSSASDTFDWKLSTQDGAYVQGSWILSDTVQTNRFVRITKEIPGVLHTLELSGLATAPSMVRNYELAITVLDAKR